MGVVSRTRRQWLKIAILGPAAPAVLSARKEFWETKDPATWSEQEKEILLYQSPWARTGFARMVVEKKRHQAYGSDGRPDTGMPRPASPGVPGGTRSVPIGEPIPPVPNPDPGEPIEFRVLARWETAKPVRLAGGPEVPELTGQFHVIRLRGLPLMPPPKPKPGEEVPDPNAGMLQAIKENSRLERKGKYSIRCAHLFKGSGAEATQVLLFFPRGEDPITLADKTVTLESRFAVFHLSVKFPLKEMVYRGELAL